MDTRERKIHMRAIAWLVKSQDPAFEGNWKRRRQLLTWLSRSRANAVAFERSLRVFGSLGSLIAVQEFNVHAALCRCRSMEFRKRGGVDYGRWLMAVALLALCLALPLPPQ